MDFLKNIYAVWNIFNSLNSADPAIISEDQMLFFFF